VTRPTTFDSPLGAYCCARDVDKAPRDDTRAAACASPGYAHLYALNVDRRPRDDTRAAACRDPYWAYHYACYVDRRPRDDTRAAACASPHYAYYYARYVDECPRDDTRQAACGDPLAAYDYARDVDGRKPVRLGKVGVYEVTYLAGVVNVGCQYRTVDDWAENWRTYAEAEGLGLEPTPADVEALLEAARAAAGKEATP